MKTAAIRIIQYLSKHDEIDKDRIVVYEYGLTVLLEITISILCSFVIAGFLNLVWECCIVYVLMFAIRTYGGGLHFKLYQHCLLVSCGFVIVILLIYQYVNDLSGFFLIGMHVSALYLFMRGMTKDLNRTYEKDEITSYNKRFRINLVLLYFVLLLTHLAGRTDIIELISITMVMLTATKVIGELKHIKYLHCRNKRGGNCHE